MISKSMRENSLRLWKRGIIFLAVLGVLSVLPKANVKAAEKKENSFRYNEGVPITEGVQEPEAAQGDTSKARSTATYSTKSTVIAEGIDVSYHNGTIDWKQVKASGKIDFAILRVGYGNNETAQDDTKFLEYAKGCVDNGIPFGVYIYSYATSTSMANSEADHVIRVLSQLSNTKGMMVYYDMEDNSTTGAKSKFPDIATTFCNRMKAAGYTPGIYASKYWFTTYLTSSVFNNWSKWVAQYNNSCTYTGNYDIWQYSSNGKIPGISTVVDLNQQKVTTMNWGSGITVNSAVATPSKVSGVKNSAKSTSSLTISWNKMYNATGYQIYRSNARNGSYKKVKTITSGNTTSWKNTGLKYGRQYYYKVRATNSNGSTTKYGSFSSVLNAYTTDKYKRTLTVKYTSNTRKNAGTAYGKVKMVYRKQKMTAYCYTYDKKGKKWFRVKFKKSGKWYYGYIQASLVKEKKTKK